VPSFFLFALFAENNLRETRGIDTFFSFETIATIGICKVNNRNHPDTLTVGYNSMQHMLLRLVLMKESSQ